MKKVLIFLTGIFSILPGIATMQNGIGTPEKYKILFGGVVEAFGVLILLLIWNRKEKLQSWTVSKLKTHTIIFVLIFVVSLVLYITLFSFVDIKHETRGNLSFPLLCQGDLKEMIDISGSRIGAIEMYGIGAVEEQLMLQPEINFLVTYILLLINYVLVFSSLVYCFGINGFYLKDNASAS